MRRLAALLVFVAACNGRKPPADTPRLEVAGGVTLADDFEKDNPKWRTAEGTWTRRDGALAQTSTDHVYNVALLEAQRFGDVDVTLRFRPVSGREDASGGIVFRAKDGKNYYVVRANALEDNFRLYHTIDGSRSQIAGVTVKPPALGAWHTMRVVAVGSRIQAYLNGELLIDHTDATFGEGWVGLWTKADSVTEFDDLAIRGTPH